MDGGVRKGPGWEDRWLSARTFPTQSIVLAIQRGMLLASSLGHSVIAIWKGFKCRILTLALFFKMEILISLKKMLQRKKYALNIFFFFFTILFFLFQHTPLQISPNLLASINTFVPSQLELLFLSNLFFSVLHTDEILQWSGFRELPKLSKKQPGNHWKKMLQIEL